MDGKKPAELKDSEGNVVDVRKLRAEAAARRAEAAANYLISKGISADRVSSAGYGESRPKADNGTASGRAQNRRVEFNLYIE